MESPSKCQVENVESGKIYHRNISLRKSALKQFVCAFVINSASLLQGSTVGASSFILHHLQNYTEDTNTNSTMNTMKESVSSTLFEDFSVIDESGSWIGKKFLSLLLLKFV